MLLNSPYDGVCLCRRRETQPSVRILIAADSIGPLSSLQAGKVIALGLATGR